METITNAASAVSHAIFGGDATSSTESNQEPVNGTLGDTSKGEPYDAGNTGCEYSLIPIGRLELIIWRCRVSKTFHSLEWIFFLTSLDWYPIIDSTETEKTNPETNTSVLDTTANTTELPVRPKAEENTTDKMSSINSTASADAPGNT